MRNSIQKSVVRSWGRPAGLFVIVGVVMMLFSSAQAHAGNVGFSINVGIQHPVRCEPVVVRPCERVISRPCAPVIVQRCEPVVVRCEPTFAEREYRFGVRAGERDGYEIGYRAGLQNQCFENRCVSFPCNVSAPFRDGFAAGYARAYRDGFEQGQADRRPHGHAWGHQNKWRK